MDAILSDQLDTINDNIGNHSDFATIAQTTQAADLSSAIDADLSVGHKAEDAVMVSSTKDEIPVEEVVADHIAKNTKLYNKYVDHGNGFNGFFDFIYAEMLHGDPDDGLLEAFDATPKIPSSRPHYFPEILYPTQAVFLGVGDRTARYRQQLSNITNNDEKVSSLAYVAMRMFFYDRPLFNIDNRRLSKQQSKALDYVSVLNDFIQLHDVVLLQIANQMFGGEMESIKIRQRDIIAGMLKVAQGAPETLPAPNGSLEGLSAAESAVEASETTEEVAA